MSIRHKSVVDAPIDEVFAWFGRPGALARLSPPWQPVRLRSESRSLSDGEAELALPGGLTWVARHDPAAYTPPHQFADHLARDGLSSLPAALALRWRHTHNFEESGESRTTVIDRVDTPLGSRVLRSMFVYRHRQLADDLASHRWAAGIGTKPMTVAITGASGLVGTALSAFLTTGGHRVIRLVRRDVRQPDERQWHPLNPSPSLFDGVDAVVHLAGEYVSGRFTQAHKKAVRDSRIEPTRLLAELAAGMKSGPRIFVSASGISYYGADRGEETLTERSTVGGSFMADVVVGWEEATRSAANAGIRVVNVRTGIVQSPRSGVLQIYRPLFSVGVGGPIAGGRQWTSWIDLDDLVDIYHRAIVDERLCGAVNAVAPNPVRNADYARTLGRVLKRPTIIPVPALAPKLVLGSEGSYELAQANQKVVPATLQALGHHFRQTDVEGSLRHQLGKVTPS